MDDSAQGEAKSPSHSPVRSRWTPKPDQILILESIFNGGMVNPSKDETVRIRKVLEKFGAVGDANVFYWFQNRRSRSRRRQRQIQAGLLTAASSSSNGPVQNSPPTAAVPFEYPASVACYNSFAPGGPPCIGDASSSASAPACFAHDLFSISQQMGLSDINQNSVLCPSADISCSLPYPSAGSITVFINGAATQVPRGPFDFVAMFGQNEDTILVHSSGVPVPVTEHGILLQMGESYFLVSGHA